MPRRRRVVIRGVAHHVTQRGNDRQDVLIEEGDFKNYCYWINEYARRYQVSILAYCLMNNHVHFIVVPGTAEGLAALFRDAHMRYAQYFNAGRKKSGHVWQGRFYSSPLDDQHLFCAMRYVEQNPVRAGMVERAWDYEWSSAKWHVGERSRRYILVKDNKLVDRSGWKRYLQEGDLLMDQKIRHNTRMGLASARATVIENWERMMGVILHQRHPGRPRKQK